MVQWLRLHAPTAEGMGSIPGGGTKIPQAARYGQKKEKQRNKGREALKIQSKQNQFGIEIKFNWIDIYALICIK